ncbi:MAG: phosphatidylglycerophosphatase A [Gammaproteobacteria bacterium]|nr:phosphatidylglycerophosphatase A [Gammaproteobacteria bacterium]
MAAPIPLRALRDPVLLVATGFGAGLLRPAPGTWGTLAGLPLVWLLAQLATVPALLVLAGLALVGVPSAMPPVDGSASPTTAALSGTRSSVWL